eukprot:COSAG05_NODE_352_length_10911_cov_31.817139_2_plen_40_part_00
MACWMLLVSCNRQYQSIDPLAMVTIAVAQFVSFSFPFPF